MWPVVSSGGVAVAATSVSSFRLVVGERGCGPGVRRFDVEVWACDVGVRGVLVNSQRARRLTGVRSVEEERLTPPFSFWS